MSSRYSQAVRLLTTSAPAYTGVTSGSFSSGANPGLCRLFLDRPTPSTLHDKSSTRPDIRTRNTLLRVAAKRYGPQDKPCGPSALRAYGSGPASVGGSVRAVRLGVPPLPVRPVPPPSIRPHGPWSPQSPVKGPSGPAKPLTGSRSDPRSGQPRGSPSGPERLTSQAGAASLSCGLRSRPTQCPRQEHSHPP